MERVSDSVMTAFREAQAGAGIPDVDDLLAKRSALIDAHKHEMAMYGPFGMWEAERKKQLALALLRVRDKYLANPGAKMPAAGLLDAEAHADPGYVAFLNESFIGKARWIQVQDKIDAIDQRILRGGQVLRLRSSEPR